MKIRQNEMAEAFIEDMDKDVRTCFGREMDCTRTLNRVDVLVLLKYYYENDDIDNVYKLALIEYDMNKGLEYIVEIGDEE